MLSEERLILNLRGIDFKEVIAALTIVNEQ
jgi:hypothetical protein